MNKTKTKKIGDYLIPYDENGSPMTYLENRYVSISNYNKETEEFDILCGDRVERKSILDYPEGEFAYLRDDLSGRLILPPDMRPNAEFIAVFTFSGYSRGRSAANLTFINKEGVSFSMFMSDACDLLLNYDIIGGKTERIVWKHCKKGANFGVFAVRRATEV